MRTTLTIVLAITAAALVLTNGSPNRDATGQAPPSGLPGARTVIDAAAYPTLQAALDALPPTGGMVQLPPGEFVIHQPLVIRAGDACIQGVGTSTHIKNVNQQQQPALVLEHPDGWQNRKTELWRIRLTNFRITGNPQSGHGIDARGINELFIDGVTVSEHGGDGIRLDHCYEDPRICDSLITYNKQTGIDLIGCHDIVVSANQLEENNDALRCFDGYNLTMTGNNLDDHLGNGVVIENTYGSVVSGNMIEECHGTAIVLQRDCYGIALSANVIAHNGGGITLGDAHGCAVSANTFTLIKADALKIGDDSGRIAVSGNSFCDSYIGEQKIRRRIDDAQAGGIVLGGTSDVGITGNTFSSLRPSAIRLEGEQPPTRLLVSENVFVDAKLDPALAETDTAQVRDNLMGPVEETGYCRISPRK